MFSKTKLIVILTAVFGFSLSAHALELNCQSQSLIESYITLTSEEIYDAPTTLRLSDMWLDTVRSTTLYKLTETKTDAYMNKIIVARAASHGVLTLTLTQKSGYTSGQLTIGTEMTSQPRTYNMMCNR